MLDSKDQHMLWYMQFYKEVRVLAVAYINNFSFFLGKSIRYLFYLLFLYS